MNLHRNSNVPTFSAKIQGLVNWFDSPSPLQDHSNWGLQLLHYTCAWLMLRVLHCSLGNDTMVWWLCFRSLPSYGLEMNWRSAHPRVSAGSPRRHTSSVVNETRTAIIPARSGPQTCLRRATAWLSAWLSVPSLFSSPYNPISKAPYSQFNTYVHMLHRPPLNQTAHSLSHNWFCAAPYSAPPLYANPISQTK